MTQIPQLPPHIDVQDDDLLVVRQSDNKDHKVPVAALSKGNVRYVQTIDDLRAVNGMQEGQAVEIVSTGRAGLFRWSSADLSAEVAADPESGIYVAPTGQDGSAGAWVRAIDGIAGIYPAETLTTGDYVLKHTSDGPRRVPAQEVVNQSLESALSNPLPDTSPTSGSKVVLRTNEGGREVSLQDAVQAGWSDTIAAGAAWFPDTDSGIAGTSEGDYFSTPSDDAGVAVIVYRHGAGGVAEEVARTPSSALVSDAIQGSLESLRKSVKSIRRPSIWFPSPNALPLWVSGTSSYEMPRTESVMTNGVPCLKFLGSRLVYAHLLDADYWIDPSDKIDLILEAEAEAIPDSAPLGGIGLALSNDMGVNAEHLIYRSDGRVLSVNEGGEATTIQMAQPYVVGDIVRIRLSSVGESRYASVSVNGGEYGPMVATTIPLGGWLKLAIRHAMGGKARVLVDSAGSAEEEETVDSEARRALSLDVYEWNNLSEMETLFTNASGSADVHLEYGSSVIGVSFDGLGVSQSGAVNLEGSIDAESFTEIKGTLINADITHYPSFGLAYGNETIGVEGFAARRNGQVLKISVPEGSVNSVTGPEAPEWTIGDTVGIRARLVGGGPGAYIVQHFIDFDGQSYGPYEITVTSIDSVWLLGRSTSVWGGVTLINQGLPRFTKELLGDDPAPAGGGRTIYVSPSGSDSNDGSSASPLATFNAAYSMLGSQGGIIEAAGGEYREAVVFTGITGHLTVRSAPYQRAVLLGSERLSITKTPGYTRVYQAPLTSKPVGIAGRGPAMIFEMETPSKPVDPSERMALQRGQTHRLPYTEMLESGSIADLDQPGGEGMWFWDNGTIYLTATDGGDASLKSYEARARVPLSASGSSIELVRIDSMFSSGRGMSFASIGKVVRHECRSLGAYLDAFRDDAAVLISYRDEAGGAGNDGFNGHAQSGYISGDARTMNYSAVYFDPWGHDCYDDGRSFHERGECTVFGGLFEHNKKAGCVDVMGAQVTYHGTISRGADNGFYAATDPDSEDSRWGTVIDCMGCVAESNSYGFRSTSPTAVLNARNCVSRDATIAHYAATGSGALLAENCLYSGGAGVEKMGPVSVVSDTPLA